MKTIDMGITTEPPDYDRTALAIERWAETGNINAVNTVKEVYELATRLHKEIVDAVEEEGSAELVWRCVGAVKFNANANCWAAFLPHYRFVISRFKCIVYKQ